MNTLVLPELKNSLNPKLLFCFEAFVIRSWLIADSLKLSKKSNTNYAKILKSSILFKIFKSVFNYFLNSSN